MKNNKCPYYEKRNNGCSHKFTPKNRKGKRKCPYKSASNCVLYEEWATISKIIENRVLKTPPMGITGEEYD